MFLWWHLRQLKSTNVDNSVKKNALKTIERRGDANFAPRLVPFLGDMHLRYDVARVLERLGWHPRTLNESILLLVATRRWTELVNIVRRDQDAALACLSFQTPLNDYWDESQADLISICASSCIITTSVPLILSILKTLNSKRQSYPGRAYRQAIEALIDAGSSAVPYLLSALEDKDLRHDSISLLGKAGSRIAVPQLHTFLLGSDKYLAAQAADALGQIGDSVAESHIIEMMRSQ